MFNKINTMNNMNGKNRLLEKYVPVCLDMRYAIKQMLLLSHGFPNEYLNVNCL